MTKGSWIRRIGNEILDLVYPPGLYCICCGKIIDDSRTYRERRQAGRSYSIRAMSAQAMAPANRLPYSRSNTADARISARC